MDAVALQAMLLQHLRRAAGKIQAGDFGENGRVVHRFFVVKWRRTRSPKLRRQRLKSFGPRLSSFEGSTGERQDKKDDWNMECEEERTKRSWTSLGEAAEATARSRKIHVYAAGHSFKAGLKKR